jgi:hypothetical protein
VVLKEALKNIFHLYLTDLTVLNQCMVAPGISPRGT